MSVCPDTALLTRLARGRLDEASAAATQLHVDGCADCARRLSSVTVDAPATPLTPSVHEPAELVTLARGTTFDRYVVLEPLGEGGMGIVFSAYDTKLDRKVALKLLRPTRGSDGIERERARMVREAQAMARLAHPNVVAVHDVSSHRDQLFIVMELIDGSTLRDWLEATPRPSEDVVARFIEAGQGLAAAHAAGIVHRDFKPENVLIGRDGRTRVTDFGVARLTESDPESGPQRPLRAGSTGAGTMGYLAPERLAGKPADARSDQFSFCVALRDALASNRASASVRAAVARGLSEDPAARFPSMEALLQALSAERTRARRLRTLAVAAVVLTAGGVGAARTFADPCPASASSLSDVWNEGRVGKIRAAFEATKLPYAGPATTAVQRELDGLTAAWSAMHHDTCAATRVRADQSVPLFDLRMECLGQRRRELEAVIGLLETADAKLTERSLTAVQGLTPLSVCADVAALQRRPSLPTEPARLARHVELNEGLASLKAQLVAGRWTEALVASQPLIDGARTNTDTQLLAEALFMRAELLSLLEDTKDVEKALYDAVSAAVEANDDSLTAKGLTLLTMTVGYRFERYADGQRLGQLASAAVHRAKAGPEMEAQLLFGLGKVLQAEGRQDEALDRKQRGLDLLERAYGPRDLRVATGCEVVAYTLLRVGRSTDARHLYERSLDIKRLVLGPSHPLLVLATGAIGDTWIQDGDYLRARDAYQESLAISEAVFGPKNSTTASMHNNLGRTLTELGELDAAATHLAATLETYQATLGPEHSRVAFVLENKAALASARGQHDEALALLHQALSIRLKKLAPQHPLVALSHLRGADELRVVGRCADAEPEYRLSVAIYETAAPKDTDLALARLGLALCALERKRGDEALASLELALEAQPPTTNPLEQALVRIATVRALDLLAVASRGTTGALELTTPRNVAATSDAGAPSTRVSGEVGSDLQRRRRLLDEARELLSRTHHRDRPTLEQTVAQLAAQTDTPSNASP